MCALNQFLVTDPIWMKGAPSLFYGKARNVLALFCQFDACFKTCAMNFSSYFVTWSV